MKKYLALLVSLLTIMPVYSEQRPVESTPYHVKNGGFTIKSPVSRSMGGRVEIGENWVLFLDDFGTLFRIDFVLISPSDVSAMDKDKQSEEKVIQNAAGYFFNKMIKASFSDAEVVYKEMVESKGHRIAYIVINIPGGSSYLVNGKRVDTRRALFVFRNKNHLYWAQTQEKMGILGDGAPSDIKKVVPNLKSELDKFMDGIKFD